MTRLAIIVPCYNEEEILPETNRQLNVILNRMVERNKIAPESYIYYVDDGSKDRTWQLIKDICLENPCVGGIKLARNVGHQNALLAGLMTVKGDVLVSIDADLQDDVDIIEQMVDEYNVRGVEIVYGVRRRRDTDTAFKRMTAQTFYRFLHFMGVDIVLNHADFRLMGRRAIQALQEFREINLFLRGIVPLLGFQSSIVYYDRKARFAGKSKYPFKRMFALALNGITSFSVTPLRMITTLGFIIFFFSSMLGFWGLLAAMFSDSTIPGWASTVVPVYFLGGVQVFCIGILGEYIGKIYWEVKQRPRFIIEEVMESPARQSSRGTDMTTRI